MNSSPERNSFHRQCAIDQAVEEGRDPETDDDVQQALEMELMVTDRQKELEADPEWQKNNLEYDLRSNKWICDKVKASEAYAQNLYAAMCNNSFQKLDIWPLLKGETYSCSWRYAGGIIADMLETGSYIDWYCSGIGGGATEEELAEMTEEQRTKYHWYQENFVGESVVTNEVRQDLEKLGWKVVDNVDE